MVVIVDYGVGNLRSVLHKVTKAGVDAVVTSDAGEIERAEKLILPGVGAFSGGMRNLESYGLLDVLHKKVTIDRTPILGICLGMQLFAARSEEGNVQGLGWLDAEVRRFDFSGLQENLRVPHVGWNVLLPKKETPLLKGIEPDRRFYFTHSYHLVCNAAEDIVAVTHYGYDIVSIIQHDNIYGMQFHPEKSHRRGIEIVVNFAEYA